MIKEKTSSTKSAVVGFRFTFGFLLIFFSLVKANIHKVNLLINNVEMKKAILNWSTGKDAAYALYKVQLEGEYKVERLITTVNDKVKRVSMHGVREELLLRQVKALGINGDIIYLNENSNMADYESRIMNYWLESKNQGIKNSVFGDILLEELKEHRENQLSVIDVNAVFPLWNTPTSLLIDEIIDSGIKAIVICVNEAFLDKSFIGRTIDKQFVKDLPGNVDPCGENGEFHSFVYDSPNFREPVSFEIGEVVYKTYDISIKTDEEIEVKKFGYWFLDLL